MSQVPVATPRQVFARIDANVSRVMHGQEGIVRKVMAALVSGGHILLEDYPGTGKTTLAKALAKSISQVEFRRVQFTPDLLPSDILGVSVLDPRTHDFEFRPGPVFTNILLADEINRATPRTQSALLEAMAEQQVTIDGQRRVLAEPFFVIATQNPVEFRGTYPLPEAQMDRFAMQLSLGFVDRADEMAILASHVDGSVLDQLPACASLDDLRLISAAANAIRVSEEIRGYIVDVVSATRGIPEVQLPASPRASLALMRAARALALFNGEEFVTPDVVQEIAPDVIAHRLILDPQAKFAGMTARAVVARILESIKVPA